MLTSTLNGPVMQVSPVCRSRYDILCTAILSSERFWCEPGSIQLPAIADPAQERIIWTLDEMLFPFCPGEGDVLLTKQKMIKSQQDYLRLLGFNFINPVTNGQAAPVHGEGKAVEKRYQYLPYAVLPDSMETVSSWPLVNELPDLETVKLVNSKIYSWKLRCEITGKLGAACFSSDDVGAAAAAILSQGYNALVKEAYGVSGRGSVLIDGKKALERICRYIEAREMRGGKAEFVVEPFLKKTEDFSCHFSVSNEGEVQLYGVQKMRNQGFSFSKVENAQQSLVEALEEQGYFQVVGEIADALFEEGYFGPVCLDSMMTEDGMVPIVEINARMSMGLINLRFNEQMGCPSEHGVLGFYNLRVPPAFSHQELLHRLEEHGILLDRASDRGVAILNAGGIIANRPEINQPDAESSFLYDSNASTAGRVYYSIISGSSGDEFTIETELLKVMDEMGLKRY